MICLQTQSFGWSFQDGRQLTRSKGLLVARSSPIFEISDPHNQKGYGSRPGKKTSRKLKYWLDILKLSCGKLKGIKKLSRSPIIQLLSSSEFRKLKNGTIDFARSPPDDARATFGKSPIPSRGS